MTMRPRKNTKFSLVVRCVLWVVICAFTGVALANAAMGAGRRRTRPRPTPMGVVVPPPPGGCTATNAQLTITAIDNPTYQAFQLNSSVLCGGGIDGNSRCPYFIDYTLYYWAYGLWWPSRSGTLQYYDTCGRRDPQAYDVRTGPGATYSITVSTYAGDSHGPPQTLLGTTGGTFNF